MNLILAAAANYNIEQLKNFIYSARLYCDCDIALAAQNIDNETTAWLKAHGVLIFQHRLSSIPICSSRYFSYKKILSLLPEYKHIFLTDIRDLVFQRDIFSLMDSGDLHVFAEVYDRRIKDCIYNSDWIINFYGPGIHELYKNKLVICSGTTLGGRKAIEVYLDAMIPQIETAIAQDKLMTGQDQGIHNILIHSNELLEKLFRAGSNLQVRRNGDMILTAAFVKEFNLTYDAVGQAVIKNADNTVPAVIHQYDRHKFLVDVFDAQYSRILKENMPAPASLP